MAVSATNLLCAIFAKDYDIHLTEINQMVRAVLLDGAQSKHFNLAKPVPAFQVEGALFRGKDLII